MSTSDPLAFPGILKELTYVGEPRCIYTGIVGIFTPFSYAFAPQVRGLPVLLCRRLHRLEQGGTKFRYAGLNYATKV